MKKYPKIKKAASSPPASSGAPNFMHTVYAIVRKIPKGRATSYGAIAEASGIRLTARMVGWAMNAAGRAKPPVPAHRVVNSKGELSGRNFFATPTLMQELLEQEGVKVKNDKIENWDTIFWDPAGKPKAASLPERKEKTPAIKSNTAAQTARTGKKTKPAAAKGPAAKKAAKPAAKATSTKPAPKKASAKKRSAAQTAKSTNKRAADPKSKKEK
ncbi:MGMT family protein [Chitinophaga lutea]|uniref:MGMT family protein n=1 Tax=Chitinophaga lutea TaxID=2488634 RepID=A0A3N4QBG6_9BACT|nr:MGMT family protein [Chitinophaga lutea]RPE13317.1 MGMT family protein [Chitinophaga lutea]